MGDLGPKRPVSGMENSAPPRLVEPFGGDIFSIDWKVPLKREDWRPSEEAAEEAEPEVVRLAVPSTVFRLAPMVPGTVLLGRSSTIIFASFAAFALPLSLSLAS